MDQYQLKLNDKSTRAVSPINPQASYLTHKKTPSAFCRGKPKIFRMTIPAYHPKANSSHPQIFAAYRHSFIHARITAFALKNSISMTQSGKAVSRACYALPNAGIFIQAIDWGVRLFASSSSSTAGMYTGPGWFFSCRHKSANRPLVGIQ